MSHNHGGSSYEEDGYDSEKSSEHGYVHQKPLVSAEGLDSPRTPMVSRHPRVPIRNVDLIEQGDALNKFNSRLTAIESRK